jgi:selenocysteine lyase/cysteine desulfurase
MKLNESVFPAATEAARTLFDLPYDVTYLNCANMAPQLRSVTEAGFKAVRAKQMPWTITAPEWFSGAEELRALAGKVLGTTADAVALIPSVSYGIAIAAANLPVSVGQRIVLLDQEFPSNVYAWRELARKNGGRLVHIQRRNGMTWTDALEEAIDRETAIVAVPQCHWTDGSKIDLERVGRCAHAVGAGLVVDASQSLGAQVLDLDRVQPEFLVAVGYKWLLGPYGLGYLYAAPKWRELGTPIEHSWLTRAGSEDFSRLVEYTDEFRPGARRFDMGEFPQFVLVPMAIAALKQILAWGVEYISRTLAPLVQMIVEMAVEEGYSVLPADQRCTHMIGIRHRSGVSAGLGNLLRQEKIFVSIRGDSIRIAPHLYNEPRDAKRLFEVLRTTRSLLYMTLPIGSD